MNFTRIARGAVRTWILIRGKINNVRRTGLVRYGQTIRSAALSILAAQTALLPVASLHLTPAYAQGEAAEPPSTLRVASLPAEAVRFNLNSKEIEVTGYQTPTVQVGDSLDTQASKEAAAQQALRQQQEAAARAQSAARLAVQRQVETRTLAAVVTTNDADGDPQSQLYQATLANFGSDEWAAMSSLIARESGFNPSAYNARSGACGIFQALPCAKMGGMDVGTQIRWGVGYIRNRYGTPSNAWNFWLRNGWY